MPTGFVPIRSVVTQDDRISNALRRHVNAQRVLVYERHTSVNHGVRKPLGKTVLLLFLHGKPAWNLPVDVAVLFIYDNPDSVACKNETGKSCRYLA
jgi:hypothetical protein